MSTPRKKRQRAIRQIVRDKAISTQEELVGELESQGFTLTQATVSRDISEMGLRKLSDGVYALAEDLHLSRMVREFVNKAESVENQTVVVTRPGLASAVAEAIDKAELPGVIGSVAGSDTILVISRSADFASHIAELIERLRCSAE